MRTIFLGLNDFRVFALASNTFHLSELIQFEFLINLSIDLLSERHLNNRAKSRENRGAKE